MQNIIDTHVHYLDLSRFEYPWLGADAAQHRRWRPGNYVHASDGFDIGRIIVVECDAPAAYAHEEAVWMHELSCEEPRIAGVVAHAPFDDRDQLARIAALPLVRGMRDNIQGHEPSYCLQEHFVQGVRRLHGLGLHFELCITHDQLPEAIELVRQCPDGVFVLDHCGKPAIRTGLREPWATHLAELAGFDNVVCKVSGLITEAYWNAWREEDLVEYADVAVATFGPDRVLFGSDWPVNEMAGGFARWMLVAERLAAGWTDSQRDRFFRCNAERVYRLG